MIFGKPQPKSVNMQIASGTPPTCETDKKVCTKCEQEKSIVEFEKYKTKRGGYSNRCLFCERGKTHAQIEANRKKFAENRARLQAIRRKYWPYQKWTCQVCKQEKLWTDFKPNVKHPEQPSWCCKVCERSPEAHKVAEERHHQWCRENLPFYNK
jgi:hypothetical protein